jgi:hypothetical protein
MTLMATRRVTVSLDEGTLELVREAAREEGVSLSAWLNDVAAHAVRIQAGLRGVAEYEAEHGAFTEEEIREAIERLRRLGVGRTR